VISHLPPEQGCGLLAGLEPALQADVLRRLADLDEANPEILREVERGLESRLGAQTRRDRRRADGLAMVSRFLDAAGSRTRRQILDNLAGHDRTLAGELSPASLLTFADLVRLDDASLAILLREADPSVLRLALAGAEPALLKRVLAYHPPREARRVQRSLEQLGPMRLSDVEEAQRQIATLARDLADDERLALPGTRQRRAAA